MRALVVLIALVILSGPAMAENTDPYSGTRIFATGKPFAVFVDDLRTAIKANKMGIVAEACATCGAKSIDVIIPGNQVIMVFRPDFAVRMLKASEAAGIEAPLRLYITEQQDGTARLTYRLPSQIFGAYGSRQLDEMAAELDGIFAKIVKDAIAKR